MIWSSPAPQFGQWCMSMSAHRGWRAVASRGIAPRRVSSQVAAFEEGVESFGDESRQRGPSASLDVGDEAGRVLLQRRAIDAKPQTRPKPH